MKIALSLSGGGFRATLYHLGVIRYLRDVGLLENVEKITCVSGGAIIGAHIVHNWEKYTGDEEAFLSIAEELIGFTQKGVRGRILRRTPWLFVRSLLPWFKTSKTQQFEKELGALFKEKSEFLSQANSQGEQKRPYLYILATNLTLGEPCAFHPKGFDIDSNLHEKRVKLRSDHIKTTFAVASSAAFPGFFPPIEVTRELLGTTTYLPDNPVHHLTDGGVYDNLGIRKLQFLDNINDIDLIIMSDAGATFEKEFSGFSGFIKTALRASDILTQRVGQLEYETLSLKQDSSKGFPETVQVRMTDIILDHTGTQIDGDGLQLAIQGIRTDLDRFSDLEVSKLVQHGYSICRQAIKQHNGSIKASFENGCTTWNPLKNIGADDKESIAGKQNNHRKILLKSSKRKLRIFDVKDWISWFNIFILLMLFFSVYTYIDKNITRTSFLKESYPLQFDVRFKYQPDFAPKFAEKVFENSPKIYQLAIDYFDVENKASFNLEDKLNDLIKGQDKKALELKKFYTVLIPLMQELNNKVGRGRAYLSQTKDRWQGTLYYEFPKSNNFSWFGLTYDRMMGNTVKVIMDFEGWQINFDKEDAMHKQLCVRFFQHAHINSGITFPDQIMQFIFDIEAQIGKKGDKKFKNGILKLDGVYDLNTENLDRRVL